MAGNLPEIGIRAQQFRVDVEARLGDDAIHRTTHSDTFPSQRTEQTGCPYVGFYSWLNNRQGEEGALGTPEASVGSETLKDLRDDDRNDTKVLLFLESMIQALRMGILGPVEKVRPRVRVDDYHVRDERADLHASTSPSHSSLPRSRRRAR